ncbi:MAG TPA: alkaline phosphatase family protein [Candidatus Limnocylindrales bacterium]|nr:alkaline phosphatase family protein [Candidatus Limnocylindrales bacterium]
MAAVLACSLAVMVAGLSCTSSEPAARHPVFIIGVDGLEWRLVREMLAERQLPNLAALLERGRYGQLETMHPSMSPAIWTSIATGVSPRRHGIRTFLKPRGQLYTNRDRRTKALWNIASEHGRRSHVIGWWMTFPVEPISGIMVAQVNSSVSGDRQPDAIYKGGMVSSLEHQVHPPELSQRMLGIAAEVEADLNVIADSIFAAPVQPHADVATLWKQSLWSVRADATYERVSLEALKVQPDVDLFMVYFGGTDVLGHRFWRWTYPREFRFPPSAESLAAYGSVMTDYYRYMDEVIGRIVEVAPEDATIIVISDHGMGPANRKSPYDPEAKGTRARSGAHGRTEAFLALAGANIAPTEPERDLTRLQPEDVDDLGSIFDVAPTVLALLDLPVGRDMEGKVRSELLDPAFLAAHPLRYVPTHTPPDWKEARRMPQAQTPAEQERLEQLRSLGYIQ